MNNGNTILSELSGFFESTMEVYSIPEKNIKKITKLTVYIVL